MTGQIARSFSFLTNWQILTIGPILLIFARVKNSYEKTPRKSGLFADGAAAFADQARLAGIHGRFVKEVDGAVA